MSYIEPLISIIIPCYNQGFFLSETIESVIRQSYTNWECIIVNDGSTDNTPNIAQYYCQKYSKIKYIEQANQGLSSARNNGIKQSQGKYILSLDSDDLIGVTYIEKAIKILEENKNIKIVYCQAELFGKMHGKWTLPPYSLETILGRNCIFCTAIYSREDFDKTKGYNSNMKYGFEDWDFWLSIIELNPHCEVHQINEVLFYYRIRKKSMARQLDAKKYDYLRKQIWLNHRHLYASYFYSPTDSFEYTQIINSLEYKLGKLLITPIKKVLNLFS